MTVRRDLTLRGFIAGAFSSLTNLDSRVWRTFRLLLARPGALTAEYVADRDAPQLAPLHVFLIANVVFFLAANFLPVLTLDTPLDVHLRNAWHSDIAVRAVRERLASRENLDFAVFRAQFDYAARQQARSLVIVLVPLFAAAVALLRLRQREPAGQHIAFALHLLAFLLLLAVAMSIVIAAARAAFGRDRLSGEDPLIPAAFLTALAVWLVAGFRTAYGSGRVAAAAQALIIALLFLPALLLYRLLLFFTVLYSV